MKKILTVILAIMLSCTVLVAGCKETKPDTPPTDGTEQNKDPDKQEDPNDQNNPNEPDKEPGGQDEPEKIEGLEVVSEAEINTFQSDALRLFGRTYLQQKKLCLDNGATGFEVTFYGTKLEADLIPMTNALYYRVFIDGDSEGTLKKPVANRVYTLAKDLEEGVHTVRLVKSISSQNGVLKVNKLTTDGKFLRPEKKERPRIEFVGDSITVGAGIFGDTTGKGCTVDNSDAAKCYAYLTAQALDADYSIVATEGICVKKTIGWLTINMLEMYEQLSSVTAGEYTYPEESHDVVVIGLGTNDGYAMSGDKTYTQDLFAKDYTELLDLVRSKNPHAKIVCVYGMMGVNSAIENGIMQAIGEKGDATISYLQLPAEQKGADGHPSLEGAKQQSEVLLEYLNEIL